MTQNVSHFEFQDGQHTKDAFYHTIGKLVPINISVNATNISLYAPEIEILIK